MVVEDKQYEKISKAEKIIQESKKGPFNLDKLHYYFSHSKDMDYNSIHKIENKLKTQKIEGRHDSKKKDSKNIFDDDKKSTELVRLNILVILVFIKNIIINDLNLW